MKSTRRNALIGLGTLTVGGGALFGSGAFSQAEARRELNVNVVTNFDVALDYVDVLINAGEYASIGLENADGNSVDPDTVFPTSDGYSQSITVTNKASLIQNELTIVFGTTDNELPPNSRVTYNNLFHLINDDDGSSTSYDVTFQTNRDDLLQSGGATSPTFTVGAATNQQEDFDLVTNDSQTETDELTIVIS